MTRSLARLLAASVSTATLASLSIAAVVAAPLASAAPDPSGTPIAPGQYTVVGFDSQSPPYPASPSVDGTAQGAIDNDYSTQWTSAVVGASSAPGAHWIALDVGGSFRLTGLDYSVKQQSNGPIKNYQVFTTNDASVATNPTANWGAPVATGTFVQPTSHTQVQTVLFSSPVTGRYVKLQSDSTYNLGNIVAASEIRIRATGDTTPAPTTATPPPPVNPAQTVAIANGHGLTVRVGTAFPQVVSYDLDGRQIGGQPGLLRTFTINGLPQVAVTTMTSTSNRATYTSTFPTMPNLTITSTITATDQGTVEFAVTGIDGSASDTVNQLSIANHSLVSVDSGDAASVLARTRISTDSATTADRFIAIQSTTPMDAAAVGAPYAFVSNSQLSAGIITNATDDSAQDNNDNWNTRLQTKIVEPGNGSRRAEVSVGNWTWAPTGATAAAVRHYDLPTATVVLAADLNQDGTVTWQDGAIAYRDHMTQPLGSNRVPDRVVQHIPFNFASQATNPFLTTLDNVKRIAQTTDDLGQWVLEKGYANEGHDSGHPDYGGDYNARAGGLADLNTLTAEGAKYNADFAVHVNVTEAYPQANAFSDVLISGQVNGWNWLNQSYHIDQRTDLGSGAVLDRFRQLRTEAPGIRTVYLDAYYSSGWLADGLATELGKMGFEVASEWAYKFEGSSIWSHWANDKNYGGSANKGINSRIARFIANADRDVWNTDPLLGGDQVKEFEGWTGQSDWNTFYKNIWTTNLPTKFLQHYDLLTWNPGVTATLTDGVQVAIVGGQRQITMGGTPVLTGGTYLLPWGDVADSSQVSSPSHADKMYYYNATGGSATFTLTNQFQDVAGFELFRLTDQGRVKVGDVTPANGQVTISGTQATPYVLVPTGGAAATPAANYGAGSGITDPGFNAGNLAAWGPTGGATIVRSANGDNRARLGADDSTIAQELKGLVPGARYTVLADIEIAPGQRRPVTLRVAGQDVHASNSFDLTPLQNTVAADAEAGTYAQRAMVSFISGRNGQVNVAIGATAGTASVTIDNVRLVKAGTVGVATPVTGPDTVPSEPVDNQVVSENFEGNQPGWGPFVKGDAGGTTDPRTSISGLHAPYSQKTWKNSYRPYDSGALQGQAIDDVLVGNHSLKSHEENSGLVFRTVPATVGFTANHAYRVQFDYQTNLTSQWQWVTGADRVSDGDLSSIEIKRETFAPALDTASYDRVFTAGCGDTWVGLRKIGSANGTDFVIDNFTVTDLGTVTGGAACASIGAPSAFEINPSGASQLVTSFTNNESSDATNVGLTLGALPTGWTAQVTGENGNVFAVVQPGQTVRTTWLVTPPAGAAGTSLDLSPTATYFNQCATKSVSTNTTLSVATRSIVPTSSMTASADSVNLTSGSGEGPAANVLDGDLGTIWHTQYDPSITSYPHWVRLAFNGDYAVDGFGYQGRQKGGQNGKVKDYQVFVSQDGSTWTRVASGSLVDTPGMQAVSFPAVSARFVKFQADNALNGQPFAAAAELRVYGTGAASVSGFDPAVRQADGGC